MDLRPYQSKAIEEISGYFRKDVRKVLLHLATGGGKTHCFSYMIKECRDRGMRSIMAVRGRKLVQQASDRLWREDVSHGVMMAGHWNYKPQSPIQICSIDTIRSRMEWPKAELIVIDEAHMATGESYKMMLSKYPKAFVVGVTATPYVRRGLRHIADAVVHPISMKELYALGYLVPPRYFCPPAADLTGVRISKATGDYQQDDLARAVDKTVLIGDLVEHWKRLAHGKSTLYFAVSVEHSKHIAEAFNQAGIPAVHVDADSSDAERDSAIEQLRTGAIRVITNVGIFCTGVDIPFLQCIGMARPTQSYNLYIQQAGRGTRPWEGKSEFLLLDHAGNVHVHGAIDEEPPCNLDGYAKSPRERSAAKSLSTCKACYATWDGGGPCPECGAQATKTRKVEQVDGELKEFNPPPSRPMLKFEAEEFCMDEINNAIRAGRNIWSAFYRVKDRYGDCMAKTVFFATCKRLGVNPPRPGQRAQL